MFIIVDFSSTSKSRLPKNFQKSPKQKKTIELKILSWKNNKTASQLKHSHEVPISNIMSSRNTQLLNLSKFKVEDLIFSKPMKNQSHDFSRIYLSVKNQDGSIGDVVLPTERLFSYGVQDNYNKNGLEVTLCLSSGRQPDYEGVTDDERPFIEALEKIFEACRSHVHENRVKLKKFNFEPRDLKTPLKMHQIDKNTGEKKDNVGPTLRTKISYSPKSEAYLTTLFDDTVDSYDLRKLRDDESRFNITAAVKVSDIYVGGSNVSVIVKLQEGHVELQNSSSSSLLRSRLRPTAASVTAPMVIKEDEDDGESKDDGDGDDDGHGSLSEDEDEDEAAPAPAPRKKITVKRKVRKVRRGPKL